MKRYFKEVGFLFLLVSLPIIIVVILFIIAFSIVGWYADMEQSKIQKEITAYVLENKDTIEINAPYGYQHFEYACTGLVSASVEFGYYYSKNDTHNISTAADNRYKDGYREDGIGSDPVDWYYSEKICNHWYYYEFHDG